MGRISFSVIPPRLRRPPRGIWIALRLLLAVAVLLTCSRSAEAIVVGHVSNIVPNTTISPTSYPGWTQGDPGWANFSVAGSYVYLGDGWVLSARHVGYNKDAGITFQTASGPVTYQMAGARVENNTLVHGPYYLDYGYGGGSTHHFAVSNPATVRTETGKTLTLTQHTDLQLFRINGDPGLPPLTIASQPMPSNFVRTNAPEVVMVGGGAGRAAAQSGWNVIQHSQDDWEWSLATGAGSYQGYWSDGTAQKRWGTNRLTDPRANGPGDPSDPNATNYANLFAGVVSDTTGVLKVTTGDGVTRDVLSLMTVYDQQGQPGTSPAPYGVSNLEAQAIPGDSGSAVFYKRGGQWELAGIVNVTFNYTDQPFGTAIYGNSTMMSDLWHYNQDYFHSIRNIIETHPDYSIIGDVNLDGIVSGNGTGPASSDDVTAFVAGWQYNNGTGQGTITSWKSGDFTRDGKTDVADFLRLRSALNGQVSGATLTALFGSSVVPEPSAIGLALLAGASLACLVQRQRRDVL